MLRAVDLDLDVIRLPDPLPPVGPPTGTCRSGAGRARSSSTTRTSSPSTRCSTATPPTSSPRAQASCDALVLAVHAGLPPYDGTHQRWLAELTRLTSA